MSVRASFAAVALVGTVFVVGCAQTSSPTSPSSSASSSVSGTALVTPSTSNFAPLLAQLNRVDNFLVSANRHLNECLAPNHPPGPCDENTLTFYLKANAALDDVAPLYPPGLPAGTDALNAIVGQANITLGLCVSLPPGPPSRCFPEIITQVQHTISVATSLESCTADVCTAP